MSWIKTNHSSITNLITPKKELHSSLINITEVLPNFHSIQYYTDGSYQPDIGTNKMHMGYGWTTSNLDELNVAYHGSLQYFPSSVKAEIMAILTALITAPFGGLIMINTDSQAAIDAYHKSANLSSISPQRYNKTNNNTLWTSIHHIILTLILLNSTTLRRILVSLSYLNYTVYES
ncbi:hypothetical protein RhiirB3_439090 [Rhizophagus irregularis]|nr:hypothetical protein RhiirB3_439090 [Rhizophagus irregularis]